MNQVACTFLIFTTVVAVAWDPVRPGALVKPVGDMIIINQSVRVLLKFGNLNVVKENVKQIQQGVTLIKDRMTYRNISNVRLDRKIEAIQMKVTKVENNFLRSKDKRAAAALAIGITSLVGLGVTSIGLFADVRSRVNNMEKHVARIDDLEDETEDIQLTIGELITNLETISTELSNVKEHIDLIQILDQLYIKINELDTEMEQLIQDLVMANAGHVTSTLFSISQLINVTQQARDEWNFLPFFDDSNIALYYPILNSFLNSTGVIIDIPFSSELKYHIYNLIPFPMKYNNSIVTVDTNITSPINYILSINGLKESVIVNDDLFKCKRTNINLYLCPATYFTFNEALSQSCEASLVKNVSISSNCHFKEVDSDPRHETVVNSHYFFFVDSTTVSVVCPNLEPKIAAITGLYRVPDQCEFFSSYLSTVAYRKETITLKVENVLQNIDITMPAREPTLNIKRINRLRNKVVKRLPHDKTNLFIHFLVPLIIVLFVLIVIILLLVRKLRLQRPKKRHISAP